MVDKGESQHDCESNSIKIKWCLVDFSEKPIKTELELGTIV